MTQGWQMEWRSRLPLGVKEDVMVVIERETTVTNDERMPIMVEYVTEAADVIVVLEGVVELMKGVKRAVEMSEQWWAK